MINIKFKTKSTMLVHWITIWVNVSNPRASNDSRVKGSTANNSHWLSRIVYESINNSVKQWTIQKRVFYIFMIFKNIFLPA